MVATYEEGEVYSEQMSLWNQIPYTSNSQNGCKSGTGTNYGNHTIEHYHRQYMGTAYKNETNAKTTEATQCQCTKHE